MEVKFGLQDLELIRTRLNLPRKENRPPLKRVRPKSSLFPEPEYTGTNHLEEWLKALASGAQPLSVLAKQVLGVARMHVSSQVPHIRTPFVCRFLTSELVGLPRGRSC